MIFRIPVDDNINYYADITLRQNLTSIFRKIDNNVIINILSNIDHRISDIFDCFVNSIIDDHIIKYPKLGVLTIHLISQKNLEVDNSCLEGWLFTFDFSQYSVANIYKKLLSLDMNYTDISGIFDIKQTTNIYDKFQQTVGKKRNISVECYKCNNAILINIEKFINKPIPLCHTCDKIYKLHSNKIVEDLYEIVHYQL
jgi:hypothetical protein